MNLLCPQTLISSRNLKSYLDSQWDFFFYPWSFLNYIFKFLSIKYDFFQLLISSLGQLQFKKQTIWCQFVYA